MVKDDASSSLLVVDPEEKKTLSSVLAQIQVDFPEINKIQVAFTRQSKWQEQYQSETSSMFEFLVPETWSRDEKGPSGQKIQLVKDLAPIQLGDLCICPFTFPGLEKSSVLYAVTQVNENSTKIPLLFTGHSLTVGYFRTMEALILHQKLWIRREIGELGWIKRTQTSESSMALSRSSGVSSMKQ